MSQDFDDSFIHYFVEKVETDIAVHERMKVVEGDSWTEDYKEGYTDGLKRALELLDPKN